MQALVDDGVLQIQGHLLLNVDLVTEVLKRNDLENIADEQAEAAEIAEAESAKQDLILLIIDTMQT